MYSGVMYLFAIFGVNLAFSYLPVFHTMLGPVPAMTLFVGAIFVLRDYVQREVGHFSLVYMAVGALLSFMFADPKIALASVAAFGISELAEWVVFTITKKPFKDRVWLSCLVATPLDTVVFLAGIGFLSPGGVVAMVLSKMIAATGVWVYYAHQDAAGDPAVVEANNAYYDLTNRQK